MPQIEHSRIDASHCIHKHLANARIHIIECYTSAAKYSETMICDNIQAVLNNLNKFVKLLSFRYFPDAYTPLSPYLVGEVANVRRVLMAIAREFCTLDDIPISSRIAFFDEITYAIGHLNNIEEHLLELVLPPKYANTSQESNTTTREKDGEQDQENTKNT